ncbi:MAG TPA: thioredoxin-like domain-containing protein [Bacteroidales bacterium]|nr:thioredoxin-like domain-containing protein [Bacteroidales bacterium]HNS47643.1 thioredoxin-like domain-containing protein [Bacteroidales bacterium]
MKNNFFIWGIILLWQVNSHTALGQEKYHIAFSVKNLPDSVCYLVRYTGDKTYLVDTALVKEHAFAFEGDADLERGMYMLAGQAKNKYIDFIVNDASRFRIETDTVDWIGNIRVRGSEENQLFFDYISYLQNKRKLVDSLNRLHSADSMNDPMKTTVEAQIKSIDSEVYRYQKELVDLHRGTFFAAFLLASLEPDELNALKQNPLSAEKEKLFRDYKDHYWDHFNLTDERLLHSPLFHPRMERYMDDLVFPAPDSIAQEIDSILSRTSTNKAVYEYLIWYFTLKYERSKIMGHDAVFVHMANRYFKTGKADFMNETVRQNIIKRSNILEPLLIGKAAPLMILLDTSDIPVSLYQIGKAYTIIYFWDSDCSFCRKETPRLKQFYDEKKDSLDLEVYAVCIDTSLVEWKKYIIEHELEWVNVNGYLSLTPDFHDLYDVHSSPVMYLLDREKNIIAKHILTEQIIELLGRKQ